MARLSISEKSEMNRFTESERFLLCDIVSEPERLKTLHSLKDKGYIRFKGSQDSLQFFERIKK